MTQTEIKRFKERLAALEAKAKEKYPDLKDVSFVEHATNAWMRTSWQLGATEAMARDILLEAQSLIQDLPSILNDYVTECCLDRVPGYGVGQAWLQKQGYLEGWRVEKDTEATVGPIKDVGNPFETAVPW